MAPTGNQGESSPDARSPERCVMRRRSRHLPWASDQGGVNVSMPPVGIVVRVIPVPRQGADAGPVRRPVPAVFAWSAQPISHLSAGDMPGRGSGLLGDPRAARISRNPTGAADRQIS